MKIEWKNCGSQYDRIIADSMDYIDRRMLCLEKKSWNETAKDIAENVLLGKNGQFRNVVGFVEDKPAVFVMFGTEFSGRELRVYNILVTPSMRGQGIGKQAIKDLMDERNIFGFDQTYDRIVTSVFPDNDPSYDMFVESGLGFSHYNDGLVDMERKL